MHFYLDADLTWLPMNPNYVTVNVEAQKQSEESHLKLYKNLVQLRKMDSIRYGVTETLVQEPIFAFSR